MISHPTKISKYIKRKKIRIDRDSSRVIARAHIPGNLLRITKIINRVLSLSENEAKTILDTVIDNFSDRHINIVELLLLNFNKVSEYLPPNTEVSAVKKTLIGAYFTMEYSIESAALFNPSMVQHPNQKGVAEGSVRFIMSLRATGEGHISSIVFHSGIIDKSCSIEFNNVSNFVQTPAILHDPFYNNQLFRLQLNEMNAWNHTSKRVMDQLPDVFTFEELKVVVHVLHINPEFESDNKTITIINWLANSNYKIKFDEKTKLSERVVFPVSENESKGIEDARFVKFVDEKDDVTYYGTYTAYNGITILSQLIETKDFITFNISTLNGKAIQNKGMALFPRKINGKFVMLSRQDGENNYIMFSDNILFWQSAQIIQEPKLPWEYIQIGNCGSPIEINEGWLVLTHGVGPMRQYSIGAILLDLENPSKIIGYLEDPLLAPNEEERDGYVPNVTYSCGGLVHNNKLIIPYAMSDISSGIATISVKDLLSCMKYIT
jgi:predicted GH43/DUF377 family glycosyl hydrolase